MRDSPSTPNKVMPQDQAIPTDCIQEFLFLWNRTKTDYPRNATIHELFEIQAQREPNAVAVVFKDQQLTYGKLNEYANQLAHHLRSLGVKRGSMVTICLERSIEMVISMLGILKAGAAYVPLDVSYPAQRLSFMLKDTGANVLLTREGLLDRFSNEDVHAVCLDRDADLISIQPTSDLKLEIGGDDLAYVMYTSGSTGKPKGVEVLHKGVIRLVCETNYIQLSESYHVAHLNNCSFDASTFEVWGALLSGARLVILEQEVILSPWILAHRLHAEGINVLLLTTALFNLLAKEAPQVLAGIDHLLFGGEAVDPQWVRRVLDEGGTGRLLHVYGPTENTTFTTVYEVLSVPEGVVTVPIGPPIANTQVYVLDGQMNPVPIGVPGELYIGGDGLARGYLNRPELTAERFVDDPFSEKTFNKGRPDSRLYRTGDMVRWLPEGILEFLGRKDNQVKLRGFRIELGEIESVLRNHDSVGEAVVLLREDTPGDKRIVAYVVAHKKGPFSIKELRAYLIKKLPEYMIPSFFVQMETLPLTPNGKVDRSALPVPDRSQTESKEDYIAPQTPVEKELAEIWKEVLGIKSIGINDNFLMLGGHSLNAVQIIARVLDRLQVDLPLYLIFESKNLGEVARYLEQKGACKRELHTSSIQPVDRNNPIPVSFSQERVYFIQRLDPENIAYNFQSVFYFKGNLNVRALEQSLYEIIQRHEIYRTTFSSSEGGQVVQIIHDPFPPKLPVVDLRSLPESQRNKEAERIIEQEIRKPFDISQLFLIRWILIRLKNTEYKLIHIEHHLVHDGWSFNVFLGELLQLYKSFNEGNGPPLSELPIQFADFAHWQRQWMEGEIAERQLAYWKTKLTGCPPLLELPYDHPRPPRQTFHGAAIRSEISPDLYQSVMDHNHQTNTTLFMTLFSALVVLLHRYSGQDDICVGTGMANRRWRDTEGLIGMIINNVVLRTDLSEDPMVRELLERIREISLEACTNQDLPFERVVEALHPERNLSHNPLFQVMFGLHDAPMPDVDLPGLKCSLKLGINNGSSKFDLTVIIFPQSYQYVDQYKDKDERLIMLWEYNKDLFEPGTIERMIDHYLILLEQIISKPNQRISELSLLTAAEQKELLMSRNQTKTDYPRQSSIPELFELQVKRDPNALVIVFKDRQLTYSELNESANQLAHYLRSLGVKRGSLVAVCLERSIEMVISMLGILKAGGAYVPLDVGYPARRLSFMLQDTGSDVLLTREGLLDRFSNEGVHVVCLDRDKDLINTRPVSDPDMETVGDDLAYVMYTSGSTGAPKGVKILHRGVVRLVCNTDYIQLGAADRVAHISNCSFDASTFEVWGALLSGARLVVLDQDIVLSPGVLAEHLKAEGISVLFLTTALFNLLAKESPQVLAGIDNLLFGGEAADPQQVRKVADENGTGRLLHVYGPTENTTFTTCYEVSSVPKEAITVPIGRPIANTQVYVLDSQMEPVPVSVPGELYIGGDGLARGYLNRPELTAERFVDDPFSEVQGSRLYRTGDMVRWLPDSILEFIGRQDDQVKLRGFRIELGEIESVLKNHESIQEAVVLLREDEPGEKCLVAYVVPNKEDLFSPDDLRSYLRKRLPDYMVPAFYVKLDHIPLTPNGKVDRKKLLPLEGHHQAQEAFVAPQTETEHKVAAIWQRLLKMDNIGANENFFDMGGHSLLATQVISRLCETFDMELPLSSIFENPTIEGLARFIEAFQWAGHDSETQVVNTTKNRESGEL